MAPTDRCVPYGEDFLASISDLNKTIGQAAGFGEGAPALKDTTPGATCCGDAIDDLVAWWGLGDFAGEQSQLKDYSGHGNHGQYDNSSTPHQFMTMGVGTGLGVGAPADTGSTLFGPPSVAWWPSSMSGPSGLDGQAIVSGFTGGESFGGAGGFTMNIWATCSTDAGHFSSSYSGGGAASGSMYPAGIIGKRGPASLLPGSVYSNGVFIWLPGSTDYPAMNAGDSTNAVRVDSPQQMGSGANMLTGAYHDGTIKLYHNAQLVGWATLPPATRPIIGSIQFGGIDFNALLSGSFGPFRGSVDEASFYRRELTIQEIQRIYTNGGVLQNPASNVSGNVPGTAFPFMMGK